MAWTRSLAAIDGEILGQEAKLQRVLAAGSRERSAQGRSALIASLHERLAGLWRERERTVAGFERPA